MSRSQPHPRARSQTTVIHWCNNSGVNSTPALRETRCYTVLLVNRCNVGVGLHAIETTARRPACRTGTQPAGQPGSPLASHTASTSRVESMRSWNRVECEQNQEGVNAQAGTQLTCHFADCGERGSPMLREKFQTAGNFFSAPNIEEPRSQQSAHPPCRPVAS